MNIKDYIKRAMKMNNDKLLEAFNVSINAAIQANNESFGAYILQQVRNDTYTKQEVQDLITDSLVEYGLIIRSNLKTSDGKSIKTADSKFFWAKQ